MDEHVACAWCVVECGIRRCLLARSLPRRRFTTDCIEHAASPIDRIQDTAAAAADGWKSEIFRPQSRSWRVCPRAWLLYQSIDCGLGLGWKMRKRGTSSLAD